MIVSPFHRRVIQLTDALRLLPADVTEAEIRLLVRALSLALDDLAVELEYLPPRARVLSTRGGKPIDQEEASGAKALLLNIVHRAAADWILYRTSTRLEHKTMAEDAFRWLFKEGPGHPDWRDRERDGKALTSFLGICRALDLDPENLRARIKSMTPQQAIGRGRPAEYRRPRVETVKAPLALPPKTRG